MLAWLVKQRLAGLLIINEMLLSIVGGCRVRTRACFRAAGLEVGVELRGGGGGAAGLGFGLLCACLIASLIGSVVDRHAH